MFYFGSVKQKIKMSENLQQENIMKKLQDELDGVDEKYLGDSESENCAKCVEKLNIYTQFISDSFNGGLHFHHDSDDVLMCSALEETNAKVQHDLNTIRECFDSRKEFETQAMDSLSEGMSKFCSETFINN